MAIGLVDQFAVPTTASDAYTDECIRSHRIELEQCGPLHHGTCHADLAECRITFASVQPIARLSTEHRSVDDTWDAADAPLACAIKYVLPNYGSIESEAGRSDPIWAEIHRSTLDYGKQFIWVGPTHRFPARLLPELCPSDDIVRKREWFATIGPRQ